MQGSVDEERLLEYQNRVASWIGNQGIFFQLRYAGIVGNYSLFTQFWNLLMKLLVVAAVAIGIGYLLLNRHFASENYGEKIGEGISRALGAGEIEASGLSRARGQGVFRDVKLTGGDDSFYMQAEMDSLSGPFNFFAGVTEEWAPEEVRIRQASFQLKAGGGEGEMEQAFARIIESFSGTQLKSISIDLLDLDWGYSKLTYGSITDTAFSANLVEGDWMISLSGGLFTQNWLKDLELRSAELVCGPEGLNIESLELEMGEGTLNFSGKIAGSLAMPEFDLTGKFESLPVEQLIRLTGVRIQDFLSGTISGGLKVNGSTNRIITTKGTAKIEDGDTVTIREKWSILSMLSVLDINNTYRRVDFESGSFSFSTADGGLKISDLILDAGDLMRLEGNLETRLPTQKEAADSLGITLTEGFGKGDDITDVSGAAALEEERISLKRAADGGKVNDLNVDLLEEKAGPRRSRDGQLSAKQLEEKRLRIAMSVHRVSGSLTVGVAENAFSDYPSLQKNYSVDQKGWRWLPFEFDTTFSKISQEQAEQLRLESLAGRRAVEDSERD
ncbi:MAG: hypothetical protein QNK83_00245 [Akkermansiaceae bacterium]